MKPPMPIVQAVTAVLIVLGFFGLAYLPAFTKFAPDPAMVETTKAVMLILVGYLFGSSAGSAKKDDTIAAQAASLTPADPAFADTQPPKGTR